MTSTSFHALPTGCREPLCNTCERWEGAKVLPASPAPLDAHAAEVRRMKAIVGQRKFQAPVADDFSRGMLADGQLPDDTSLRTRRGGLITGLMAWWRREKSG